MLPQGTWAATAVNQQEPEFEYGMFTLPGDKEGGDYTIGAADLALSISGNFPSVSTPSTEVGEPSTS